MSANASTPDPTAGERDAATLRTVAAELVRREALGDWWESDWPDTKEGAIGSLYAVVAQIKADAETKARADERERIARAIEGLPEYDGAGWPNHAHEIKEDAARIARGDA